MSRYIFILTAAAALLAGSNTAAAQGYTLKYNQTLLVGAQQTVPSGRVWKVESVLTSSGLTSGISVSTSQIVSNYATILVDGTPIYVEGVIYTNYSSYGKAMTDLQPTRLPLWLPANTTLEASANVAKISVVEFIEVP